MKSKIIILSLFIAAFALAGSADAAQVTFDTSGIPAQPVAGETYLVPVTISGSDVFGFLFTADYDSSSANVTFQNTGGAQSGGTPGHNTLIGSNGATSFTLAVKPLSNCNITLNFSQIYDESFEDITVASPSCVLTFNFDAPTVTPSATPTPTPSETPSPTPSETPSPTPSATPTPTPDSDDKITWDAGNVTFNNGAAVIPVFITGANRVQGITVKVSNISGGNVSLNASDSVVQFNPATGSKILYYTSDLGYTNAGTAQLFVVEISDAAGPYVNFTLTYKVTVSGKDATAEYIKTPVVVSIPVDDSIEPFIPPTPISDFLIDVPESVPFGEEVQIPVRANGSKNWTNFRMEFSKNTRISTEGSILGNLNNNNDTHVLMYMGSDDSLITDNSLLFTIIVPASENMSENVTMNIIEIYRKLEPIAPAVNPITFTIIYEKPIVRYDTGDNATTIDDQVIENGSFVVTDQIPVRRDYAFLGWTLNGETVYADKTINSDKSVTLTATWGKVPETANTDQLECISVISNYMMKKTSTIDMSYDLDKNGQVQLFDMICLLQYIADNEEIIS